MSLSDILTPRPEVLRKEGIEGIIDIENLWDRRKKTLESRASEFLSLTFPTSDIKTVVQNLDARFNTRGRSAGLFLLEGLKGSGKSHVELFVYHMLSDRRAAELWLAEHGLKMTAPEGHIVLVRKFTDQPLYLEPIWSFVFKELGVPEADIPANAPSLQQFKHALGEKRLILILDELETGIKSLGDQQRAQNIGFLQMLSEEAHRTETASITLFASVYSSNDEPGATLKRVQPRVDVKFSEPADRQRIILHRLFENYQAVQRSKIEPVITSYVNYWRNIGSALDDRYQDRFLRSFPFTPELLDMLLHRVLRRDFQGTRGPLGLLATVVRFLYKDADIISAAHFDVSNTVIRNRLSDLDPGQHLIQCAQNDLRDLQQLKYGPQIISAVLLSTLTATGSANGIGERDLIHQVLKPGDDINDFSASLNAFERLATYLQHSEGSYFFDLQEKPNAKVEYRSLRVDAADALDFALTRWKSSVFNDPQAVVYKDGTQARAELNMTDKNSIRFVLAPRRLEDQERREIYRGIENQNLVLILEPHADTFNALKNPDIVKWAQRARAAKDLQESATDADRRRQYEKIGNDDLKFIDDKFRKAALHYVSVRPAENGKTTLQFELEPLGAALPRQDVLTQMQQTIYPRQVFEEHLTGCLNNPETCGLILNKTMSEIRSIYRKTLGFPVLTVQNTLIDALRNLCRDRKITLQNSRSRHCGSTPAFSGSEWDDVVVLEPSEETPGQAGLWQGVAARSDASRAEPTEAAGKPMQSQEAAPSTAFVEARSQNVASIGLLRQDVAAKLAEVTEGTVVRVRFVVYLDRDNEELGSLPAALRGSLSGIGDVSLELDIEEQGEFSKAQVEQMAEQLPTFPGATYRAELRIRVPAAEQENAE